METGTIVRISGFEIGASHGVYEVVDWETAYPGMCALTADGGWSEFLVKRDNIILVCLVEDRRDL